MNNGKVRYLFELLLIIVIFLVISYIVQSNIDFFKEFLGKGFLGILIYIIFVQLAIVFVPLSSMPLVPLASNIWGPFNTSLINVFSWTLGSTIVFLISRKWGISIIGKLIPLKEIHKIENKIPKENEFWSIVFLRMIVPVDILSYALGLLSNIKLRNYILATFIGIIPFAFIFSYLGSVPFIYQLLAFIIAMIFILTGLIVKELRKNR